MKLDLSIPAMTISKAAANWTFKECPCGKTAHIVETRNFTEHCTYEPEVIFRPCGHRFYGTFDLSSSRLRYIWRLL
jgi:hypothetical protein